MKQKAVTRLRNSVTVRSDLTGVEYAPNEVVSIQSTDLARLAESYGIYQCEKNITSTVEETSSEFYRGFIQGMFDADGTVIGSQEKGISVRITQSRLDRLCALQRMLLRLGINSTLYKNRMPAGLRNLPDGKGGTSEYHCEAVHELVISKDNLQRFEEIIGFSEPAKISKLRNLIGGYQRTPNRERFTTRIKSIEPDGIENVYDCTIPGAREFDANGLEAHNCAEIILARNGFCNLCDINLIAFIGDKPGLARALYIVGRANYRQTMMELEDGVLQEAWHRQNEFLRLCGVGLTGIAGRPDLTSYDYKRMANIARHAAYSMAEELDLPLPKNVTTVKPSGSISKIASCEEWGEVPEGIHKPLGRYIFNAITFSRHDPLVKLLHNANYRVIDPKPDEPESVLIVFPIRYDNVPFNKKTILRKHTDPETGQITEVEEEIEVNLDSAVSQLEHYRMIMENWCDQNASITVSYDPEEIPAIAKWLDRYWDTYVGVSFLLRTDPTKTPEDLGYPYLPQEVVTESEWIRYAEQLVPVDWNQVMFHDLAEEKDCALGSCPLR